MSCAAAMKIVGPEFDIKVQSSSNWCLSEHPSNVWIKTKSLKEFEVKR